MMSEIDKKVWAIASANQTQIFMNMFMSWMIGYSLNIFSIIFTI